jgi:TIR domain
MNPKVFVSHASEDKDRFVLGFARKLRESGIDAWLDKWEMLPGDSLVEKIFEEGLKEASAIIIVLSGNSVNKPWVKEELNASIMSKLNKGSKIIPVVLDDSDVPESLKSTLWEKINGPMHQT